MAEEVKGSEMISTESTGESTQKTYTEAEVQALLQSEADRRVSSALKKQQKEFETKMAEAEKLKSMDESQRKDYEYNQKLQELEKREQEFNLAQNKLEATKVLSNRGLPVEFVDYIVADDAESMMENITTFEKLFKACVADEVARKISTSTPKSGFTQQKGMTHDDFKRLSIAQRSQLRQSNPELYNQLKNN